MTEFARILLVETQAPAGRGSMSRYSDLVSRSLELADSDHLKLKITRLNLGIPFSVSRRLPAGFATWLNHLWIHLTGPVRIRQKSPHLVHLLDGSYAYLLRGSAVSPTIATVHDLIPLLQNLGRFGRARGSWLASWLIQRSIVGLRRCSMLLADSSNTAQDLVELAGVEQQRIRIAPLALGPDFLAAVACRGTTAVENGEQMPRLILHVGHNGYYKNREGVIRIFARVRAMKESRLIMVGPQPAESLVELVKSLSLEQDVKFVIDPDDNALVELYSRALVFLFPSLYEGFGWPPLEAMACGCPVVCSTEGSLVEVVGDAALLRPAADESGLAELCLSILEDDELATKLRRRGRDWARQFDLQRMRRDLLQVYGAALGGKEFGATVVFRSDVRDGKL